MIAPAFFFVALHLAISATGLAGLMTGSAIEERCERAEGRSALDTRFR
jgi:hypothetical protein